MPGPDVVQAVRGIAAKASIAGSFICASAKSVNNKDICYTNMTTAQAGQKICFFPKGSG
jgi:predicted transcriptional regulator